MISFQKVKIEWLLFFSWEDEEHELNLKFRSLIKTLCMDEFHWYMMIFEAGFCFSFFCFLITDTPGTPSNGQSKSASELYTMLASWVVT